MKTYIVGRSKKSDIHITNADNTVSGFHLELIKDTDGKYYVIDRKSTNGTFRQQDKQKIQQSYVHFDEPLLLGSYKTTIRKLLNMRTVERNPETGEIISRK